MSGDVDDGALGNDDNNGAGELIRFSHARTGEEYDSQLENG